MKSKFEFQIVVQRFTAVLFSTLTLLAIFLAACGEQTSKAPLTSIRPAPDSTIASSTSNANAASSGTMIGGFDVGPAGNFGGFNPMIAGAGHTWYLKYFSPLVLYDVNFQKIQGELAVSWEIAPDGKSYTFHLRPSVKWHDGQPFTSADVKFSIELLKNPDSAALLTSRVQNIKEITTPDPLTAVIILVQPTASLLDALTLAYMYPEHLLGTLSAKELLKSSWWQTNPVGTGPFKWSRYVPDQYVELVANPQYWRGAPKLAKLINRSFKDVSAAILALRAGEIQFTYITSDDMQSLPLQAPNVIIVKGPSQVTNFLGFNMHEPRLQDLRVRQAFLYALDRQSITAQLFKSSASTVPCIFSDTRYLPPQGLNAYPFDLNKARNLLAAAHWNDIKGQPLEILSYYTDDLSQNILTTTQQMLRQAGIEVKLHLVDTPTYNQLSIAGNFDIIYAGAANGPDPDITSTYFTSAGAIKQYNINNLSLDTLYSQGQQETNPDKRAAIYQNVCEILNTALPWGPLWETTRFGAVSKQVQNFVYTPAPGGGRYYDAAETWTLSKTS